jgi:hypothetical protein
MATNLYLRLRQLLAGPPLQVGIVTAVSGTDVAVQLPDGGVIRARGDAALSDSVFVRDGVIEGVAPSLPIEVIEI